LAKLILDADGIFDDELAIEIALQKKAVERLYYDGEKK
jgi:inosine-uridine nucleoside N-ribohydrolase